MSPLDSPSNQPIQLVQRDETSFTSSEIEPNSVALFLFSAALWVGHRIHYDLEYARDNEGLERVLIHGPLQTSFMINALELWLAGEWTLQSISYRHTASAPLGSKLRIEGRCDTPSGESTRVVEVRCMLDDSATTVAKCTVVKNG